MVSINQSIFNSNHFQLGSINHVDQIASNLKKVSKLALPLLALASIPIAQAGMASYMACIATCPALAMMAPPPLFSYTLESCMSSCSWMMSPACP